MFISATNAKLSADDTNENIVLQINYHKIKSRICTGHA